MWFRTILFQALRARKLLNKGCQGFLAYIVDTNRELQKLEDIPVVKDFADVFPDEYFLPSWLKETSSSN